MTRKTPMGADMSQPGTGFSDKSDDDNGSQMVIISVKDLFDKVKKEVEQNYGYQIKPEIGGLFCGYSIYKREHQLPIKGITTSDRFWYWRQINPDREATSFLAALKESCESLMSHCPTEEISTYKAIALCFLDNPTDPRSIVYRIASGAHQFHTKENTSRSVTLGGTSGHYKVVPPLSWFPKALQDYDARQLLTLLPDAEARQLMLILGRAVVGCNGSESAEGTIEHTARSYGILIGKEAGMGKSTLTNDFINSALIKLGFAVSNAPINDTKFGWGTIAQSDFAFIDDLTEDVQRRLLTDVKIKSIVSNGVLKVEEKGIPAVDVKASTVILACANSHSYSHYIQMDSGSISRVNQMDTYDTKELAKAYPGVPDARIKPFWEALATELKVSTDCLAAYLLRRSADYFLETTGYTWDDGRLFKHNEDNLEVITKANRELFRIDTSLRHAEELVTAIGHLVALSIADTAEHKRGMYYELLDHLDFSSSLMLAILRLHSTTKLSNKLPDAFASVGLPNASWDCKDFVSKKLGELDRLPTIKTSEDAFASVVKELKSTKGFGYPGKSCHYMNDWTTAKRSIPDWVSEYSEVVKQGVPKNIQLAIAEVQKIFNDLG